MNLRSVTVNIGLWVWPSVHFSEVDLFASRAQKVSVIWNSEVSVVQGLLYYWSLWSYNPDLGNSLI